MSHYDIEFFWDPVCPFAWITSRWITKVSAQTGYKVDWRFISLRLLNKQKDYAHEVSVLERLIVKHKQSPGSRLLDVACGTGQHI